MASRNKKQQHVKSRFLLGCAIVVFVLFIIRRCDPSVMKSLPSQIETLVDSLANDSLLPQGATAPTSPEVEQNDLQPVQPEPETPAPSPQNASEKASDTTDSASNDSTTSKYAYLPNAQHVTPIPDGPMSILALPRMSDTRHRLYSVTDFDSCFPDSQQLQIEAATQHGVAPLPDRAAADGIMHRVVYMGSCPYVVMDKTMESSIPYLVPRASKLLQRIGRNFLDSLAVKHMAPHRIIVSSVLRTQADVSKLTQGNVNATSNSCHQYATTFDILYNRFSPITGTAAPVDDTYDTNLKAVLAEVLRDLRLEGKCYVKFERQQPCFHITVR